MLVILAAPMVMVSAVVRTPCTSGSVSWQVALAMQWGMLQVGLPVWQHA